MIAKTEMTLSGGRIVAGVWEGLLTGAGPTAPILQVTHLGTTLDGVELLPAPDAGLLVRVPIPVETLNDGIQTFLIQSEGHTLAQFSIIAGVPLDDDLRAEINLMRAELDLLKRAFRRHCAETSV